MDFKNTDSLISGSDLDAWSIDRVLYREDFSGKIWLSKANSGVLHWQETVLPTPW